MSEINRSKSPEIKAELIIRAAAMLRSRVNYWADREAESCAENGAVTPGAITDRCTHSTYESALDILQAAIDGDEEMLNQFDYYEHLDKPVKPADVDGCHCIYDVCIKNYADPTEYCKGCECNEEVTD